MKHWRILCGLCLGLMTISSHRGYSQEDLEVYLLADTDSKTSLFVDDTSYGCEDSFAFITDHQSSLDSFVVHSITLLSGAVAVAGLSSTGVFLSSGKVFGSRANSVLLTLAGGAVVAGYLVKRVKGNEGLSSMVLFSAASPESGSLESQETKEHEGRHGSSGGGGGSEGPNTNIGGLAGAAAFAASQNTTENFPAEMKVIFEKIDALNLTQKDVHDAVKKSRLKQIKMDALAKSLAVLEVTREDVNKVVNRFREKMAEKAKLNTASNEEKMRKPGEEIVD